MRPNEGFAPRAGACRSTGRALEPDKKRASQLGGLFDVCDVLARRAKNPKQVPPLLIISAVALRFNFEVYATDIISRQRTAAKIFSVPLIQILCDLRPR